MAESSPRSRSRQSSFGTDPCERFELNPFKIAILFQKETCIHCGRLWTDHEGASAEDVFEGNLQVFRKASDLLRRGSKSGEWLLDGEETKGHSSSGEDDLFHMMSPNSLAHVNAECQGAREIPGTTKVYSFIDFKECNVPNRAQSSQPSTRLCDTPEDLSLALQEAQDEVMTLRQRCEALEAQKLACALLDADRLCRELALADGPPETAPEAARPTVGLRELEELQKSCALAIARLKEAPERLKPGREIPPPNKVHEDPAPAPEAPVVSAPRSPRFLPKRLHGAAVLTQLAPEVYRVENRLHAQTRGLAYRRSKCPTDVDPNLVAPWGSTVSGRDSGEWIQCEAHVSFWAPWAEVHQEPEVLEEGIVDSVRKRFGDLVSHLNSIP